MDMRVAGAQIPVTRDISANRDTLLRAIEQAAREKADMLLTPEGSLSGYTHDFDAPAVSAALDVVCSAAKAHHLGLALGTCFIEPEDRNCYNQLRFYEQDGSYLGFHSKILCCGSIEDNPGGEINHYAVRPLETRTFKGICIGGLICNDMWANPCCTPQDDPHLATTLSQQGAQVILHAVNGGRSADPVSDLWRMYHEANLRARARAARTWIVTVDNCFPTNLPCAAPSGVIDPEGTFAYRAAAMGEEIFTYTLGIPTK